MAGELTATMVGQAKVGSAALKALIDSVTLTAATDFIKTVYVGEGQISVIKILRAA